MKGEKQSGEMPKYCYAMSLVKWKVKNSQVKPKYCYALKMSTQGLKVKNEMKGGKQSDQMISEKPSGPIQSGQMTGEKPLGQPQIHDCYAVSLVRWKVKSILFRW